MKANWSCDVMSPDVIIKYAVLIDFIMVGWCQAMTMIIVHAVEYLYENELLEVLV